MSAVKNLGSTLETLVHPDNLASLERHFDRPITTCLDPRLVFFSGPRRRHEGGGLGLTVAETIVRGNESLVNGLGYLGNVVAGGHYKGCAFDIHLPSIVRKVANSDPQVMSLAGNLLEISKQQGKTSRTWLSHVKPRIISSVIDRTEPLAASLEQHHQPGEFITYMDNRESGVDNVLTPQADKADPSGYVFDLSAAPGLGFDGTGIANSGELPQVYLNESRHVLDTTFAEPELFAANLLVAAATRLCVDELHPDLPTFAITGDSFDRQIVELSI